MAPQRGQEFLQHLIEFALRQLALPRAWFASPGPDEASPSTSLEQDDPPGVEDVHPWRCEEAAVALPVPTDLQLRLPGVHIERLDDLIHHHIARRREEISAG